MQQTILLVDDDKNLADDLLVTLEQSGYDILYVQRAVDVAPQWQKADLVILDLGLLGDVPMEWIIQWKSSKNIPVILTSALVTTHDRYAVSYTHLTLPTKRIV